MPLLESRLGEHPCFGRCGSGVSGRIHLPVAPKCNVQCAFCDRKYDCANESRPGVTSKVLTPEQAVLRAKKALAAEPRIRVIGIAGPGDPLANPETFETFRLVSKEIPEAVLCLSTNGLLLEEKMDEVLDCGVDTLTVTVNTLRAETAAQIYSYVTSESGCLSGLAAGEYLVNKQRMALERCAREKCVVKINTVLIPGINDGEIEEIAKMAKLYGCTVMNVMPLIPCGAMKERRAPELEELLETRETVKRYLPILAHCRQCRADAVGII